MKKLTITKVMKSAAMAALALAAISTLSACSNDDSEQNSILYTYGFELETTASQGFYNTQGYWDNVYDPSIKSLGIEPNLYISHSATVTEFDGVTYKSWKGFCPSRCTDNKDYTNADWTEHQWGSITGGGSFGSTDYLLACWDVQEKLNVITDDPSCGMSFSGGALPVSVRVTNSAYGYYGMLNGTAFSAPFGPTDWCRVNIIGVRDGKRVGAVTFYLAENGQILNEWKTVDLTPIGDKVDYIYFQMESSDTGEWGMNNPAYFCIDDLTVQYSL